MFLVCSRRWDRWDDAKRGKLSRKKQHSAHSNINSLEQITYFCWQVQTEKHIDATVLNRIWLSETSQNFTIEPQAIRFVRVRHNSYFMTSAFPTTVCAQRVSVICWANLLWHLASTEKEDTTGCLKLNYSIKKNEIKKIKIALSLGYFNSYFCNKRWNMFI